MPLASATTDVIGAAAAVAAVLVALAFGLREWFSRVRDRRDADHLRAREQAEKERTQAEMVTGWAEQRVGDKRPVVVQNESDNVVKDVEIWLITPRSPAPAAGVPDRTPSARTKVLSANARFEHPVSATGGLLPKRPDVIIRFRDAAGRRWLRGVDDRLERVPD
jgi:hypothetical protein